LFVAVAVIPPPEGDLPAVHADEPVVGNGDTMCIAPQIVDHLLGVAEGPFTINPKFPLELA
jgi:hypothetical protein